MTENNVGSCDHDSGIIHRHNDKWYFWNETWSHRHGPFETRREARLALARYLGILNQQPNYTCQ